MTLPQDSLLTTLSALLMTGYFPGIVSMIRERGTPTMQAIGTHDTLANYGSNIFRYEVGMSDSARFGAHIQRDFGSPRTGRAASLDYYYDPDEQNPQTQDFRGVDVVAHISNADLEQTRNATEMYNLAQRITKNAFNTLNEAPSYLIHSDKTGRLGTVSAKLDFDSAAYDGASSYTSGATTAWIQVGEHSIGAYKRDMVLETRNTSGALTASEIKVIRVDPINDAIAVQITDKSAAAGTSNLNSIAATDIIYRAGEYNAGFPCAINEICKTDYSGDSSSNWMRKDRLAADNAIFLPEALYRSGASSKEVEIEDLDELGNAYEAVWSKDNHDPLKLIGGLRLIQTLRRNADENAIRVVTVTDSNGERRTGKSRYVHTHPHLGDIEIEGDPTARDDRLILMPRDSIKMMYAGMKGMKVFTNQHGIFDRIDGVNASGGGSKNFKLEASAVMTPVVKDFSQFGAAFNLTA